VQVVCIIQTDDSQSIDFSEECAGMWINDGIMKNSRIMADQRMVMGFLLLGLTAMVGAAEAEPWVLLSGNGQKIVVEAEGTTRFSTVSSAVFNAAAETQRFGISG
jgi:hypothetical protein